MKLLAPTLEIEAGATPVLINEVFRKLPGQQDPFAILSRDELIYMQAVWNRDGFCLEYQEGSIDRHYWTKENISVEDAIWAFQEYFAGRDGWPQQFEFEKKDIRGFWRRLTLLAES
ncbi:MAG: hypothetical protein V3R24_02515 [Gemmatimonadales bacterium]